jgi:hypothetical protein
VTPASCRAGTGLVVGGRFSLSPVSRTIEPHPMTRRWHAHSSNAQSFPENRSADKYPRHFRLVSFAFALPPRAIRLPLLRYQCCEGEIWTSNRLFSHFSIESSIGPSREHPSPHLMLPSGIENGVTIEMNETIQWSNRHPLPFIESPIRNQPASVTDDSHQRGVALHDR